MARLLDFEVLICDPRQEFVHGWEEQHGRFVPGMPDEAVLNIQTDERTAIVALTHDPRLDDMALLTALNSRAFYIGALGSRANSRKRRENLAVLGLGAEAIARLHGPIGLHIGSHTPAEIALSLMAHIVAIKNGVELTITAIVLAAGQGSRFRAQAGQDKLLAPCVGRDGVTRPVFEQVLVNLPASITRRWVVTSPARSEVIRLARAYGCEVLLVDSSGMGDSIAAAVATSGPAAGWLVVLGDMPFIQAASIERVIERVEGVSVLVHAGQQGHPVAFGPELGPALM
eukprot:gene25049-25165_t